MAKEELFVFSAEKKIGRLWLDQQKKFNFEYSEAWLLDQENFPISISLPLKKEPYKNDASRPYFSNLLPEEKIRKVVSEKFGLSEANDFGLLQAIGGDCAGAVSLLLEDDGAHPPNDTYQKLGSEELEKIIDNLPERPLLAGEDGLRLSLAGAQNKVPLYFEKDVFFLPKGRLPSSHILKPASSRFPNTIENEAFCMRLAEKVGLSVPKVHVWRGQKQNAYVIERYDRVKSEASNKVLRIHQEDFCQALSCDASQKYQAEGGPGFKECFALADKFQLPVNDKKALISWAIFNLLIGNVDAHAKNVSLLITHEGFCLAPFYDLMCTTVYPTLTKKLAMKIGTAYDSNGVSKRHWIEFSQVAGIKDKIVFDECLRLAEALPVQGEKLLKEFSAEYGQVGLLSEICEKLQITSRSMLEWAK